MAKNGHRGYLCPPVSTVIDKVLGLRCTSFGYQYGEIVEFYNLRGGKERIFDDMNNGFGWARLPKSFMAEKYSEPNAIKDSTGSICYLGEQHQNLNV